MISLRFEPPVGDAGWDGWMDKAKKEKRRLLAGGEGPRVINEDLYKGPRDRLLAATHRKCAYCELALPAGQRQGDVEHYRPKGRARDGNGKIVKVIREGVEVDHPGYYWLAYDYRNLLPACLACNRRANDFASGMLTGKADIFPTLDEHWASYPEDVPSEKPALLNPWLPEDDPAAHLEFDPKTGRIVGITDRGEITVALLGLNREGLPEARLKACYMTGAALEKASSDMPTDLDFAMLRDVRDGSAEFAAICRAELARRLREYEERRARIYDAATGHTPGT